MNTPARIQLQRSKGWRKPEGAVVVSRPSKWGNPYRFHTPYGLARMPAIDGSAWEYEGRISADGARHDMHLPGGRIIVTHVRYMTLAECAQVFRTALVGSDSRLHLWDRKLHRVLTVQDAVNDLAGKDLACWCPLVDAEGNHVPCHADILLEVANAGTS